MRVTNNSDVSLALAVWALHSEYDYIDDPAYISVTTLMKPLRHIILPSRIPPAMRETPDVMDFVASALGSSIHDGVERAWVNGRDKALALLGIPKDIIEKILINPTVEDLCEKPDSIPIYLERRRTKEISGWKVGGKFDMIADGQLQDHKSTTAYTWLFGGKDDDYILQLSLYRWLNQDIVHNDVGRINFVFTDWQKVQARTNPNYPQKRVEYKEYPLLSLSETEKWVEWKLSQIAKYKDAPELEIPHCTDEELWLSEPSYKYYSDPEKAKLGGRSTKNFDSLAEANQFWRVEKGGKGIVKTIPGEPKRCEYCSAFPICSQKNKFVIEKV